MHDLAEPMERLVPWIRSQFPQVDRLRSGRGRIYLDNAAGTLMPQSVADALAESALWSNPQPDRSWPSAPETKREHLRARALLRDFLNAGESDPVFLSESTTASLYKLREGLEPGWAPGDNVVVTDCDHFANISAWEWRARWEVRRARMLPDGGLDLEHLTSLVDDRTRVVALAMAGNGLGTLLPLHAAIPAVRERAPRAVVVVDAVHSAPHVPIDVQTLGADALAFSTYKLFGPNAGVLWLRPGLLETLDPYHVAPHTDAETLLEWGTLSNLTVSGIGAALDYLQRVGTRLEPAAVGAYPDLPRNRRLFKLALAGARDYERDLSRYVLESLGALPEVELLGVTDPERVGERVPTFAFALRGMDPGTLEQHLWRDNGLQVAMGTHYSAAVLRGLRRTQVARASFAHYTSRRDAEDFVGTLRQAVAAAR